MAQVMEISPTASLTIIALWALGIAGVIVVGRYGLDRAFHALGAVVFAASVAVLLYFLVHALD